MTITTEQAAIDLAIACGLCALIGHERQWRRLSLKPTVFG